MTLRGPPDERSVGALLSFGVVNLDKPPGPSSHQVAAWVRDAVDDALDDGPRVDRVAHGGTLDPKVTGCLPLLLGEAARAAQVFDDATKEYVTILELHDRAPPDVESVISEFEGDVYQTPPRKSAVVRERRVRTVHDIEILEAADRRLLLRIRCESGTYVRKLCHHLGLALGTGAHMGELRRTATGTFDDAALVSLYDLVDALAFWLEDGDEEPLRAVVEPAERALAHLPSVVIAPSAARQVAEGAPVYAPGVIAVHRGADEESAADGSANDGPADDGPLEDGSVADEPDVGDLVVCETPDGAAVALGHYQGGATAETGTVVDLERVLV